MNIRFLVGIVLVFMFVAGSSPLPVSTHQWLGGLLSPTAQAKSKVRSLLDRLTGKTMPEGIVKTNGRIEATQVDVSAKYPGRLADITVEEGSEVKAGQVVGRISSPEYEAQLRAAQSNVERAKQCDGRGGIAHRPAQRRVGVGQIRFRTRSGTHRKADHHPADVRSAPAAIMKGPRPASRERRRSAIKPMPPSRVRRPRSSASNRCCMISFLSRRERGGCNTSSRATEKWSPPAEKS